MNPVTDLLFDVLQDADDLRGRLDRFTRWEYITSKQADKLANMVEPSLPCLLSLSHRAKRGPVYVKIGGGEYAKTFRLDANARVHPLASV